MFTEAQARDAIKVYRENAGKTQSQIAKELGVSDGQLSAFLSGTYKTPHTIIPKVEQLLSLNTKKEIAPREPAFRKTTVSTIVMDLIAYSHVQRKIGVVYGDAGIGKTMGINAYREENPDTSI
ncbi:MAG: helix-turn-helix domain-containing protein, partial [Anaerotignaceae bacterium]